MEEMIREFKKELGKKVKEGETYTGIEAPKGEFGLWLVSRGEEKPYRCKIRAPGYCNIQSIGYMAKGVRLADVVTLIGTIDVVLGEIDR